MCRFTLGYFGVPLGIGLFAVASRFLGNGFHSWWSGRQSSVKTVQSSHLLILSGWTPILTTTVLRKPWKPRYIYIYICVCFAINYHVYPGNLLETWETIGFCSDRLPEAQYPPGSQTAKRSPRRSRHIDMPSLAPCRPKVWI